MSSNYTSVIASEAKQSQECEKNETPAIASLHFITLAMTILMG